jgi:hypothetical protein
MGSWSYWTENQGVYIEHKICTLQQMCDFFKNCDITNKVPLKSKGKGLKLLNNSNM